MRSHLPLKATLLVLFCCLVDSCKKEPAYMSDAIITDYDARACPCCGGLMINFDGKKEPYKGDFKLIENSSDLHIKANDGFRIYVEVDWTADPDICAGN